MKAAGKVIQVLALSTLFAVQALTGGEVEMTGVRRAIQTIAASGPSTQLVLPAGSAATDDGAFAA